MRVKEIMVSVKRVIQTAPYESSAVELNQTVELDEDDDAGEVRNEVYADVTRMVKRAIDNEAKKYGRKEKSNG